MITPLGLSEEGVCSREAHERRHLDEAHGRTSAPWRWGEVVILEGFSEEVTLS